MEDYKIEYNNLLKRYYHGCFYLENNKDEWDKYIPLLLDILNKIEEIIFKHSNMTNDEILNGFIV